MILLAILSLLTCQVHGQDDGNVFKPDPLTPGPWVKMSQGAIWPRPAQQSSGLDFFVLDPENFKIQVSIDIKTSVRVFSPFFLVRVSGGLTTLRVLLRKTLKTV